MKANGRGKAIFRYLWPVEIAQGNSKFATYLNGDYVITDVTLAEFFGVFFYVFSINNGFLFVTGDKEFEKFEGVEFRKK